MKKIILGWMLGAIIFVGAYGGSEVLNREFSAKSRSPSSTSISRMSDLPSVEVDERHTAVRSSRDFFSTPPTLLPLATVDHRANVLIDIGSIPNHTKLNGYGGYIGYKTIPGSNTIDRFIYCQNFDESTLKVDQRLIRTDVTSEFHFPCVGFDIQELLEGMSLIEFLGINALKLQLSPGFDPNKGGTLNISFLAKPIVYRTLKLSIVRIPSGSFQALSPTNLPFDQLDLEFRNSGFFTSGFPSGLSALALFQQAPNNPTRVSLGRLVVDTDLPKSN